MFLHSHPGFVRSDIHDYLNVFFVIMNAPENKYAKVEKLLSRAMSGANLLRHRRKTINEDEI